MIDTDTIDALLRLARAREEPMDAARMVLAKGYVKRKTGTKQSSTELAAEWDAFHALRDAGVESDPEICYYNAEWDASHV
jgi:hypothetical protein